MAHYHLFNCQSFFPLTPFYNALSTHPLWSNVILIIYLNVYIIASLIPLRPPLTPVIHLVAPISILNH